ncbi:MAG: selenocysteine-specific translation elongation factor [Gammaproteobacteria bacterium]
MIIATAGHVDHGKTSLVKKITGIDTDKLPEEKNRGLTIELGFAYHDIGDGKSTGFIDVPGHEKFIRTMIAGVNGIDCVLFIIAVDDGPMPQTIEHLAIMDLLNIKHGVFALTKTDRVSASRVAEVREEVADIIKNTSLRDAAIIPVSAHSGTNVEMLCDKLLALSEAIPARNSSGKFRMAIDRNFVLQGTGRVVAGTILAGQVNQDDKIRLLPQDIELRVRGIHAQNTKSETARTGERTALNISGGDLKRLDIHRGNWVVADDARLTTTKIDTEITVLNTESRPLRNRATVHLHIGAADIGARVITLESQEIAPGETGLVQLQLNQACNAVFGDRFILRDQSALRTIGGGYVIDPVPVTRGRDKGIRLGLLKAQMTADPELALARILALDLDDFDLDAFIAARNLDDRAMEKCIANADSVVLRHDHGRSAFTHDKWRTLQTQLEKACDSFHRKYPDKLGPNEGQLIRALPKKLGKRNAAALIEACVKDKLLVRDSGQYRLPRHAVKRAPANEALWKKVSTKLASSGRKAPVVHDLHTELRVDLKQLNQFLIGAAKQGFLVKVSDKRYFMPETIREFAKMAETLANNSDGKGFTVKEYRDVSGIGRNAVIEILEYFDRIGLTFRQEQIRKIRKTATELYGD